MRNQSKRHNSNYTTTLRCGSDTYFLSSFLPPKRPPPRGTPKSVGCRETPAIPRVPNEAVEDVATETQLRTKRILEVSEIIMLYREVSNQQGNVVCCRGGGGKFVAVVVARVGTDFVMVRITPRALHAAHPTRGSVIDVRPSTTTSPCRRQ